MTELTDMDTDDYFSSYGDLEVNSNLYSLPLALPKFRVFSLSQ